MSVELRLMVRISAAPPAPRTGNLAVDLAALRGHASTTRWVPASPVPPTEAMLHGAGPSGVRVGLVLLVDGAPWSPDDTPGEISPTTGLEPHDLTVWREAIEGLHAGSTTARVQDVRFRLLPRGSEVQLTQHDIDGSVEASVRVPRAVLEEGLVRAVSQLRALTDALPALSPADGAAP